MAGYQTQVETLILGGEPLRLASLVDGNQYWDPKGEAARAGIPESYWSLFGRLWPAGKVLAEHFATAPLGPGPHLELGCGLALPGLVLHRRGADVTVTDVHPYAPRFLRRNLRLNGLPPLKYRTVDWTRPPRRLGRFAHIYASDVCYSPEHADDLARLIEGHGTDGVRLTLADPGRPEARALNRRLLAMGFSSTELRPAPGTRMRITVYQAVTPGQSS